MTKVTKLSPLNILHIASWYPSRMHRTLGNFVERHIQAISSEHSSTVVYLVKDPKLTDKYSIEERTNGSVREIICYYKKRGQLGCGYFKAFNHVMSQILEKNILDFDLVHVHVLYKAGIIALQLKNKYKLPYIITEHWNGYHRNEGRDIGPLQRTLSKRVAKNASAIVPVSRHLADAMSNFGLNSTYQVVPNVVNTKLFTRQEAHSDSFTFIHVSSLVDHHKNVSGILRAFKKVSNKIPVHLVIIGDGDIKPYLTLAKEIELPTDRIKIEGEKNLEEVAELMARANCLILFSNYENQPCVIPEAHACGLPVIATDVGGIKEHLSPSHGQLIPAANESALEEAMLYIYAHYKEYNSENLRNYTINNFSEEAVGQSYSSIYRSII